MYKEIEWLFLYLKDNYEKYDHIRHSRIQATEASLRKKVSFVCCEKQQTATAGRNVLLNSWK